MLCELVMNKGGGVALCEVCGNEIETGTSVCRFCGSIQKSSEEKQLPFFHRRINLEQGKPIVEIAMRRLSTEIQCARNENVHILTLIHGYGSSGKGGAIRRECRKTLDYMQGKREITEYIIGEEFTRRLGPVKTLLRRFPQLEKDKNLNRNNKGITLVVL